MIHSSRKASVRRSSEFIYGWESPHHEELYYRVATELVDLMVLICGFFHWFNWLRAYWVLDILKSSMKICYDPKHKFLCYFDSESCVWAMKAPVRYGCCGDIRRVAALKPEASLTFKLSKMMGSGRTPCCRVGWGLCGVRATPSPFSVCVWHLCLCLETSSSVLYAPHADASGVCWWLEKKWVYLYDIRGIFPCVCFIYIYTHIYIYIHICDIFRVLGRSYNISEHSK